MHQFHRKLPWKLPNQCDVDKRRPRQWWSVAERPVPFQPKHCSRWVQWFHQHHRARIQNRLRWLKPCVRWYNAHVLNGLQQVGSCPWFGHGVPRAQCTPQNSLENPNKAGHSLTTNQVTSQKLSGLVPYKAFQGHQWRNFHHSILHQASLQSICCSEQNPKSRRHREMQSFRMQWDWHFGFVCSTLCWSMSWFLDQHFSGQVCHCRCLSQLKNVSILAFFAYGCDAPKSHQSKQSSWMSTDVVQCLGAKSGQEGLQGTYHSESQSLKQYLKRTVYSLGMHQVDSKHLVQLASSIIKHLLGQHSSHRQLGLCTIESSDPPTTHYGTEALDLVDPALLEWPCVWILRTTWIVWLPMERLPPFTHNSMACKNKQGRLLHLFVSPGWLFL